MKVYKKRPPDTLTIDIPTIIRIMELAREDIKSDEQIHVFVTELLKQSQPITMTEYMNSVKVLKNV